ncbi:MAG: hypothetical protein ACD_20C00098G0009 [uncultured bacterium]|nr:MAG: hypothetical protein ACD_20C00098G0009 [uncultured bacterium]HBH18921.1 hypothetical protein [Cyanobacteria bacterium UBA9579]
MMQSLTNINRLYADKQNKYQPTRVIKGQEKTPASNPIKSIFANQDGIPANFLKHNLISFTGVSPEASVSANVGKTTVTSLIDADQIYGKALDYINNAQKSIQIEMFEFQNLKVDGHIWPSAGAETVAGWEKQQAILDALIQKKKENPDLNVQVILDSHKWYQDGFDHQLKHYNNMRMIKYLKDNNIDVVPYPRRYQGGGSLQHVKFLAVDSNKVILGGENWGNHSAANHDACVAIKTQPQHEHSEVDNLIDEIFNKDWKFAWQRLGVTNLAPEEDKINTNPADVPPESLEYMVVAGNVFQDPKYKNRYQNGELNLPEVKPISDPAIKILTNSPKEYEEISEQGSESIGTYIKERLNTAQSLKAELFVLSHKEIVNKIIERHKEAQNGGRPFDVQILMHPGIVDDFPYCRKTKHALEKAGIPVQMYKVDEDINQKLHAKWAIFDNKELLIGSANWSAAGLETNLASGKRDDYPLTDATINEEIYKYKPQIDNLEKSFGLASLFGEKQEINDSELKIRINSFKEFLKNKPPETTPETINNTRKLIAFYKVLKDYNTQKSQYRRGNHECAISISNEEIAKTFLRQFDKDWEYSKITVPDGYSENQSAQNIVDQKNSIRQMVMDTEPSFDTVA